jgi:xylulokinase
VATLIGYDIEIYNTTGAIGAARAGLLKDGDYEVFGKAIIENDYIMTFKPLRNKAEYQRAYQLWKKELEITINYI